MKVRLSVFFLFCFMSLFVSAQKRHTGEEAMKQNAENKMATFYDIPVQDSLSSSRRFIHRLGIEFRPAYIIPTNPFLKGKNESWKPIQASYAAHLKYSFKFRPGTYFDRIYQGAYQGVGVAYYTFGEKKQLGNPCAFYLFQGARIVCLTPKLSLNYEWNFGLSGGWKPYDENYNYYNGAVGSRMNAYINAGVYVDWTLLPCLGLTVGGDFTHFSNGNTKFPNAGINTVGAKIGLVYNFGRNEEELTSCARGEDVPTFPRHVSYDWVFFGSWRRKGVYLDYREKGIASPDVYPVAGFNFAPMYNLNYKFRFGLSLDGVYDGSANVYIEDKLVDLDGNMVTKHCFYKPSFHHQFAVGLSGRAEYVMPYFSINFGIGANVFGYGDLKGLYQVLALKIHMSRNSFLHIGYNLHNFQTPNYLMLGVGFHFRNKYPQMHR